MASNSPSTSSDLKARLAGLSKDELVTMGEICGAWNPTVGEHKMSAILGTLEAERDKAHAGSEQAEPNIRALMGRAKANFNRAHAERVRASRAAAAAPSTSRAAASTSEATPTIHCRRPAIPAPRKKKTQTQMLTCVHCGALYDPDDDGVEPNCRKHRGEFVQERQQPARRFVGEPEYVTVDEWSCCGGKGIDCPGCMPWHHRQA